MTRGDDDDFDDEFRVISTTRKCDTDDEGYGLGPYWASMPPSMTNSVPVMNLDSFEAR